MDLSPSHLTLSGHSTVTLLARLRGLSTSRPSDGDMVVKDSADRVYYIPVRNDAFEYAEENE